MKILLSMLIALLAVTVFFTDLSSASTLRSVAFPLLTVALLIVVIVVGFSALFAREQVRDYQVHASTHTHETGQKPARLPSDAKHSETTETIESTRTITYVDGKKVDDRYEEKRS